MLTFIRTNIKYSMKFKKLQKGEALYSVIGLFYFSYYLEGIFYKMFSR